MPSLLDPGDNAKPSVECQILYILINESLAATQMELLSGDWQALKHRRYVLLETSTKGVISG